MQTDIQDCMGLLSNSSEQVQKTALSASEGMGKQQIETGLSHESYGRNGHSGRECV